jgi:hypothetical protein
VQHLRVWRTSAKTKSRLPPFDSELHCGYGGKALDSCLLIHEQPEQALGG